MTANSYCCCSSPIDASVRAGSGELSRLGRRPTAAAAAALTAHQTAQNPKSGEGPRKTAANITGPMPDTRWSVKYQGTERYSLALCLIGRACARLRLSRGATSGAPRCASGRPSGRIKAGGSQRGQLGVEVLAGGADSCVAENRTHTGHRLISDRHREFDTRGVRQETRQRDQREQASLFGVKALSHLSRNKTGRRSPRPPGD